MAGTIIAGQTGVQALGDGVATPPRLLRTGELGVSEIHGRFYEQAYRSNLFAGGMSITPITAATFTSSTLGATATPIIGVWNPSSSLVNLSVLQAVLSITVTAATNTGGAPFVWAVSTGNTTNNISTGLKPWNRKTLLQSGSQAFNMAGVALTNLTNNLVIMGGSSLIGGSLGSFSFVGTAVGQVTPDAGISVENFDGSLLVPPGAILALLASGATPVAHSAASLLLWEEVPL